MRAQMYSLIALLIAVPVFIFLTYYLAVVQSPASVAMDKVVADQVREVERGMEEDFERAVNIAGRRALLALLAEISEDGFYVDDVGGKLEELMMNGTLDGNSSAVMAGNTLTEWRSRLLSVEMSFPKSLTFEIISVNNSQGFELLVRAHLAVNVSDAEGRLGVDREFTADFPVSLVDTEDPVYTVETEGMTANAIRPYRHPFHARKFVSGAASGTCFGYASFEPGSPNAYKILVTDDATGISGFAGVVSETGSPDQACYMTGVAGAVDVVNQTVQEAGYDGILIDEDSEGLWSLPFRDGLQNQNYFSGYGPGMERRLEGNLTPQDGGLVSFVNTDELALAGLAVKENQTRTDYLYFSDEIVNGKTVRGMPEWFRVDSATAARFNLTELLNP